MDVGGFLFLTKYCNIRVRRVIFFFLLGNCEHQYNAPISYPNAAAHMPSRLKARGEPAIPPWLLPSEILILLHSPLYPLRQNHTGRTGFAQGGSRGLCSCRLSTLDRAQESGSASGLGQTLTNQGPFVEPCHFSGPRSLHASERRERIRLYSIFSNSEIQ